MIVKRDVKLQMNGKIKEIKELAKAEGVSINQFLTLAAVEKMDQGRPETLWHRCSSTGNHPEYRDGPAHGGPPQITGSCWP